MSTITSLDYEQYHADLVNKIENSLAKADTITLQGIWTYLTDSEAQLILLTGGAQPPDSMPGNLEFGPTLYLLNEVVIKKYPKLEPILKKLGNPGTKVTPAIWSNWTAQVDQGAGVVVGDGTLYSNIPYGQLDTNWVMAVLSYVYYYHLDGKKATFNTNPAIKNVDNTKSSVSIAIIGDWGTGPWTDGTNQSPAMLVANAIKGLANKPDITIHLGDVYYSGWELEEEFKFIPYFPTGNMKDANNNPYNFTLNSNHEMYDGGNGYFSKALTNPLFNIQQETSYFVINYQDWVLIGLDSAYYDESFFVMQGGLDAGQKAFVQGLNIPANKKVILFTHHTGLTTDGAGINNATDSNNLFAAIVEAFSGRYPDFWYYGHTHNGIVYNANSYAGNFKTAFGLYPQLRCMGHAAIPFGNGYDLYDASGNMIAAVDYYAKTPMPAPDVRQTNRVLNGFALLTLSAGTITEQAYEVSPDSTSICKWTKTTAL